MIYMHLIRGCLSLAAERLSGISICRRARFTPEAFSDHPLEREKLSMDTISAILMLAAALVLIVVLVKVLAAPIRLLFKLAINAALGFVILFVINFFGEFVGISLGINLINALVAGFLGVPGVILLVLISLLF